MPSTTWLTKPYVVNRPSQAHGLYNPGIHESTALVAAAAAAAPAGGQLGVIDFEFNKCKPHACCCFCCKQEQQQQQHLE
jgi:hypothetical protein